MTAKVLISYSHDSPEHMENVLALSDRLRQYGIDCDLDQYEMAPPEGWPVWTKKKLTEADFVLVVCTETYRKRFDGTETQGAGLGAKWEGAFITQQLYDAESTTTKFVPVLRHQGDEEHIPTELRGHQFFVPFDEDGFIRMYRFLSNQPEVERPELGQPVPLHPRERRMGLPDQPPAGGETPAGNGAVEDRRRASIGDGDDKAPGMSGRTIGLAAAALIVAVAFGWRIIVSPEEHGATLQHRFEAKYFKTLPFSMYHTIANQPFLYWLQLVGKNNTEEPLHLEVKCRVLNDPKPATCRKVAASFTILPGESLRRKVDPQLYFIGKDSFETPLHLSLDWKVKDEQEITLWQESADITLMPKTRFYWPLSNSADERLGEEFLIASLSAWALTAKTDPTYKLGESFIDEAATMRDFMRTIYKRLLTDPNKLRISPGVPQLPPETFVEFQMPKRILATGEANPVEAGLLVGAIVQKATEFYGSRLIGVLGHPSVNDERPVLVAWTNADAEWEAIDLTSLSSSFDDNRSAATQLLEAGWYRQEALPKLDDTGVYFSPDDRLVALDFKRAQASYRIEGLP